MLWGQVLMCPAVTMHGDLDHITENEKPRHCPGTGQAVVSS